MNVKKFLPLIVLPILIGCEKENVLQQEESAYDSFVQDRASEGMIVLGNKINDPYRIDNVRNAYMNLKATYADIHEVDILPNMLYMRFLPQNEAELDLLKKDTTLMLFDFPLDYEIAVNGVYYHDPALPDSVITWQYCVVPINYNIPNVEHEIIYEVFNPTQALSVNKQKNTYVADFYNDLLAESYQLTGHKINIDNDATSSQEYQQKGVKRWHPAGQITAHDDVMGTIPLVGVKVQARWSTHIETALTDVNGRFSMGGFIYKVNYSIKWERPQWSIRDGVLGQAWYNGPKQQGDWNLYISSGKSKFYATIHRALHHYYYDNIKGLRRPPQNTNLKPQMKVGAMYEKNDDINGDYAAWRRVLGILSTIKIYNPQRRTDQIYGTTIHELAHAAHWDINHGKFNDTETIVKETWARGVQVELTKMTYPNYSTNGLYYVMSYTGLVEDLIDGIKTTRCLYWYDFSAKGKYNMVKSYYDQVQGYTIKQIEDALASQTTWNAWKNNLKNMYNNETEKHLDAAFNFWGVK